MKRKWKRPVLEVLDFSMTMKGWHDDGHDHGDDCEHSGGGVIGES
ncbi:paeninodin family lasso peptide [Virgibacillus necropolis]